MERHVAYLIGKKIANYNSGPPGKRTHSRGEGMRVDRRLFPRLHEGFELAVKGVDMFGAPFQEKTTLLNLSREGLCFLLLRPISAGGNLEFACQSSDALSRTWASGRVVWVSERFDGYQLVGLSAKGAQNSEARARQTASVA